MVTKSEDDFKGMFDNEDLNSAKYVLCINYLLFFEDMLYFK